MHLLLLVSLVSYNDVSCLRWTPGYFTLNGHYAPLTARDSSEVARPQSRLCYPHDRNSGLILCLSRSLTLSLGTSIYHFQPKLLPGPRHRGLTTKETSLRWEKGGYGAQSEAHTKSVSNQPLAAAVSKRVCTATAITWQTLLTALGFYQHPGSVLSLARKTFSLGP